MKQWLIGRNVPGGCEELCVCCVAGDTKDDAQAAFEAIDCGDKEEYCSLVYDRPEESVKDKDGNAYRVVLLPLYRLEDAENGLRDAADEMIEILMDISNWAYSIHSDAYPIKMARELLARQDAMGGWNKL